MHQAENSPLNHEQDSRIEEQTSNSMTLESMPFCGFPNVNQFENCLKNLNTQGEALISSNMASRIRTVLDSTTTMAGRIRTVLGPKTTAESPEFQRWCKTMFTLKSINNQLLICREGKPIAIWEKLFIILTRAHQQCHHGDLHKTSLEVERIYFKIPHNIINEFIKLCPICWHRTLRSPAELEDEELDMIDFDQPDRILFYLKHFGGGFGPRSYHTIKTEPISL
ncbi:hypothetical protein I7I51_02815 [Histoplasma capsulatum]|uniref:Integrase zinc-binding domain-containing protein n=1 Tax=Ajellomyces capsulatus TaxID=5037 RepID=A0A8A1MJG7_AJECA|nr:hypothetical protein I7I51_02815 [Histoplasma capsulatum]